MDQHKPILDCIGVGRQRKKRRLDLQRDNYKYHTDLTKNVVVDFVVAADHSQPKKQMMNLDGMIQLILFTTIQTNQLLPSSQILINMCIKNVYKS
jgi:hypothetical protein